MSCAPHIMVQKSLNILLSFFSKVNAKKTQSKPKVKKTNTDKMMGKPAKLFSLFL